MTPSELENLVLRQHETIGRLQKRVNHLETLIYNLRVQLDDLLTRLR